MIAKSTIYTWHCEHCNKQFEAGSAAFEQCDCICCDDCTPCHTCGGDQYGIIGIDWDSDDYINGPYDGDTTPCPNCGGSGKEKDCTYW